MFSDAVYQLGKQVLDATSLRQETISHNIANVNTNNYKSKQVVFESELKNYMSGDIKLTATHEKHYGVGTNLSFIEPTVVESSESSEMRLDGNNVDIDLEMANMAANQIQYNTLVRQVSERISNYHYVIRGN